MIETWKAILGFEGFYEVSDLGNVRSLDRIVICSLGRQMHFRGKIMKTRTVKPSGYKMVNLSKAGVNFDLLVHRLVAVAFIANPNDYPIVNHIDCNKTNNKTKNLEWATGSQNSLHAIANNLKTPACGSKMPNAILTDSKVLEIREMYSKGQRQAEIARKFNLSRKHVSKIVNRSAWKHVLKND